ncbi:MAG: hypothetical protein ACI9CD_001090 [Candidatus Deianiraeaceae bacterium]|jgi:hypothetical protein
MKIFNNHPKSFYGIFSFIFKVRIYQLFTIYITFILFISLCFSFFYDLVYTGSEISSPQQIDLMHKWYFGLMSFMSPGFTEFIPCNKLSRLIAAINSITGFSFNVLFLSILVARILLPRNPFNVVPFLLYNPEKKTLSTRVYSMLPLTCYNISFNFYRLILYEKDGIQMGTTKEINASPHNRKVLMPNYGIHISIDCDLTNTNLNIDEIKSIDKYEKIPLAWLNPTIKNGHFYLFIEAETAYGKAFQKIDFYLNKNCIKIGTHKLLNHGFVLKDTEWYKWKKYRWDLWGKTKQIDNLEQYKEDPILTSFK